MFDVAQRYARQTPFTRLHHFGFNFTRSYLKRTVGFSKFSHAQFQILSL